MINVVLAGAFGLKHLDGIERIDGVQFTGLVGRRAMRSRTGAKTGSGRP